MNSKELRDRIDSKKFIIMNAIKCINYKFDEITGRELPEFEDSLDKYDVQILFNELKKIITWNDLTFIIFNEFFFSYHTLIKDEIDEIILNCAKMITLEKQNVVLFINLCHHNCEDELPSDYYQKLGIYLNKIYDLEENPIWNISTENLAGLFNKDNNEYYSNETLVIMRGFVLYKYKKSTYCSEIYDNKFFNYLIGFGNDIINKNLNADILEISNLLSEKISIDICFDIQNQIKTKKFEKILYKNEQDKKTVEQLSEIRKNVRGYSDKKLIIIQSNTTNIYDAINIFPSNILISKSDPIQESLFSLEDKKTILEIDIIENYNQDLINYSKITGEISSRKESRLDAIFEKRKSLVESYNSHKLIKKYQAKEIIGKTLGAHQYIFFVYDNLV